MSLPASPALAAAGTSTLKLDGPAAKALRAAGVELGAVKPATGRAQKVVLPVAASLAGKTTTIVRHRGAVSLQAGRKQLRLAKLTLVLDKRARVEAKLGGERLDLFRVTGGKRQVDPTAGSIDLSGLRLKLTADGAREIGERLGLDSLRSQTFGQLTTRVSGAANGGGAPSGGGGGATKSSTCPLPSTPGPTPEDPLPAKVKPLGAVDVTGAALDWHVRDSFIRYINSGEGTSVSGGATADPPVLLPEASQALSYDFRFPFTGGWLDPGASPEAGDDSALVDFSGAVRFRYSAHGIDLSTADPEIEIAGANSRAIFAISDAGGAAKRQVLINLDLSRAAGVSVSGKTHTYERVPGAIPPGTASSTFAGFYTPGTEFGCVTVSFTTGP
ncbi:MAG TPA: HtaA domain-containing protein [Solirubrobacterales bacterium]|nr:HtaA domain-containing protein [Solirubrobacterales bacterium]